MAKTRSASAKRKQPARPEPVKRARKSRGPARHPAPEEGREPLPEVSLSDVHSALANSKLERQKLVDSFRSSLLRKAMRSAALGHWPFDEGKEAVDAMNDRLVSSAFARMFA